MATWRRTVVERPRERISDPRHAIYGRRIQWSAESRPASAAAGIIKFDVVVSAEEKKKEIDPAVMSHYGANYWIMPTRTGPPTTA